MGLLPLVVACERDDTPAADIARAAPHVPAFERFESWAHRTLEAQPAMREAALAPTLFAPLQLASEVHAARVERVCPRPGSSRCFDATHGELPACEWRSRRVDGEPLDVCHGAQATGVARTRGEVRVEMFFVASEEAR